MTIISKKIEASIGAARGFGGSTPMPLTTLLDILLMTGYLGVRRDGKEWRNVPIRQVVEESGQDWAAKVYPQWNKKPPRDDPRRVGQINLAGSHEAVFHIFSSLPLIEEQWAFPEQEVWEKWLAETPERGFTLTNKSTSSHPLAVFLNDLRGLHHFAFWKVEKWGNDHLYVLYAPNYVEDDQAVWIPLPDWAVEVSQAIQDAWQASHHSIRFDRSGYGYIQAKDIATLAPVH